MNTFGNIVCLEHGALVKNIQWFLASEMFEHGFKQWPLSVVT